MAVTCGDIPRLICSVIIPPIGVYFQVGCNKDLAINVLLTLLGCVFLPFPRRIAAGFSRDHALL